MLPASITRRRTKFGFEAPQDDFLNEALAPVLDEWIGDDAPLWEYVDRDKVLELLNLVRQVNGRANEPGQMLFRLFLADRWLRIFFGNQGTGSPVNELCDPCLSA